MKKESFRHRLFSPEVRFTAGLYLLLVILFALLRLLLLGMNDGLAAPVPTDVLLRSFLVGLRFDLAVASYLLIPLFLALLLLRGRGVWRLVIPFSAVICALLLLGVAEAEFYREFESRFNALVFEYVSHPGTVAGMIWEGYPVLRYLAVWGVLTLLFAAGIRRLYRRHLTSPCGGGGRWVRGALNVVALVLMVFLSRGGFGSMPLRWGDAFFSTDTFANHLALNGFFTLGRSGWDKIYGKQAFWTRAMPPAEARETTRGMLTLDGETPLHSDGYPLLRREPAAGAEKAPVNVVVILMESFSGRQVGALGASPSRTPDFDRLAAQGVLFERAFSSGTHTHQGVYASLTSFPNLPGYEYLMKMMEANQEFSDLPSLLHRRGYRSAFLYNGLFSWDNKEGFFRQHGVDRFIGGDSFKNPVFRDPVWGVSDQDVFARANEEFRAMAEEGPFLGIVLTLSNHSPFNLPHPLPFPRIQTGDEWEGRHNAMRYADWSLGEFFRLARQEKYFENTLFVITGDHGFPAPPIITPMQLSRFHVPLLFYGPGVLGKEGERRSTVASQVDIVPSILGLLGIDEAHQCWGRNLFSPALRDEGFAVIKPSGDQEVAALIEGDYLLMVAPKEKPQLVRYSLGFPPAGGPDLYAAEEARGKAMRQRLLAYIEAGILGLRERRLGFPEECEVKRAETAFRR